MNIKNTKFLSDVSFIKKNKNKLKTEMASHLVPQARIHE